MILTIPIIVLWSNRSRHIQNNTMKIFAISVLAAVVGSTVHATTPKRKRSIKNKYVSSNNVIEEGNREDYVAYLGYRKLEGSISMSMANDGE